MSKIKRFINNFKKLLNFKYEDIINGQNSILNQLESINNKLDNINLEAKNEIYGLQKKVDDIYKEFDYSNLEMNKLISNYNNKKKILICGFYGAINLGDDLMLETILMHLKKLNNIEITIMLCDKKNIDVTNYGKYNFIHYPSKTDDFSIIAKYFDAVIFGGGALLDDHEYDDDYPIFNLGYILINLAIQFIKYEKTTILYGLSSNKKISNKQYIKKLNFISENATIFTLRDTNSLKTLKECGINVSKIKIVDDIVLSNDALLNIKNNTSDKLKIGIVYICDFNQYNYLHNYTNKIINYLEKNKFDYEINFIPFYNHLNNDKIIYEKLIKDFNNKNLFVESMPKKFVELLYILENQDYIISMRYHATLIANFMNKNVLSIDFTNHRHYFNKINYIYNNYAFEKNSIEFFDEIKKQNLDTLFNSHVCKSYDKILLKAQHDIKLYLVNKIEKL